jgi:hypothetical protein
MSSLAKECAIANTYHTADGIFMTGKFGNYGAKCSTVLDVAVALVEFPHFDGRTHATFARCQVSAECRKKQIVSIKKKLIKKREHFPFMSEDV